MKKIFTILLAFVLIASLSVTAFAANSPVAGQKVTVIFVAHEDADLDIDTHEWHDELTVTYTAKEEHNGAKFVDWSIYLKDGSKAVEGKHYKLAKTAGAYTELTDSTIALIPLTDLIVAANFGAAATSVEDAVKSFQTSAPPTGDVVVFGLGATMLASLAGAVISKKKSK